jgi:hypothetical protein
VVSYPGAENVSSNICPIVLLSTLNIKGIVTPQIRPATGVAPGTGVGGTTVGIGIGVGGTGVGGIGVGGIGVGGTGVGGLYGVGVGGT